MYINGSEVGLAANGYTTVATPVSYIGAVREGATMYRWKGSIDDFRIYNIALSAQQVTNIFEATKALHPNNWP